MTKDRAKHLQMVFDYAEKGELDGDTFDLYRWEMIEDPNEELDHYFMEHIGIFAAYKYGSLYVWGDTWIDRFRDVVAGTYPLEQIPEHVRELAKELYYFEKSKAKAKTAK